MAAGEGGWRREAFLEYVERRAAKKEEADEARQMADKYLAISKLRETELLELDRAARLLGIVAEPENEFQGGSDDSDRGGNAETPAFKDLTIELLQSAYPGPVRAAQVQANAERKALRKFHEKTAGMTLFRLSKDGLVRRDGWNWYWVPEEERAQRKFDSEDGEDNAMT